jgi:hypothetical protein
MGRLCSEVCDEKQASETPFVRARREYGPGDEYFRGAAAARRAVCATASPQKQTADASTTDPQRPALRQRYPRYRIRSSDVIDLNFRFTPEFNQESRFNLMDISKRAGCKTMCTCKD